MSSYKYAENLEETVKKLSDFHSLEELHHQSCKGEVLPSGQQLQELIAICRSLIFPGFYGSPDVSDKNLLYHTGINAEKLFDLLVQQISAGLLFATNDPVLHNDPNQLEELAEQKAVEFISYLPEMRRVLSTDVTAMYNGDPAAQSKAEVILCYPAIRAICNYRIAHKLLTLGVPLIPRIITEMAHSETGIDIHPAATIGEYFAIDHGTGVVIGATSIIGNRVKLYQGVTLGARSFPLDEHNNPIKGIARHPIIEDDVIIYSNATILGRITIGKGAVIGGNIWVTENVAPGERLVQAKAKQ
ncbi:serine O-acetyltransferase EpsC [Barnesiella viscericola]|uniref:serine O-acetyltransferase EpsC n=1 Tax=Barnesiella viscericola TaxID=397865 RepID=UPI00320B1D90